MMSFKTFQYTLALAETGHFAKAAAKCHITQSTLSLQIQNLENYLGVELFDRQIHPIKPTMIGQKILSQASKAIDACESIKNIAKQSTNQKI